MPEKGINPAASATNVPVPGQGLTTDPKSPQKHEMPPQFTEMNEVVGSIFDDLMSKEKLSSVVKLLQEGQIFMDKVVSAYIEEGMIQGKWNADMAHTLIEPLMFIFMWIASQTNSPIVFSGATHYDSSGMDVLGEEKEEQIEEAVESLLSPKEEV